MGKEFYLVADVQLLCSPHFYNLELLVAFLNCIKFVQGTRYSKPENAIKRHCKHQTTTPKQGGGFLTLIPESDLYRLVFRSKLKSAEKFADWVFEEVLPAIRKTGYYSQGKYHYPLETAKPRIMPLEYQAWLTHDAMLDEGYNRPLEQLLVELRADGHEIAETAQEYKALYLLVNTGRLLLNEVRNIAGVGLSRELNSYFWPSF
ncbi:BRO-N domain-containing protein [Microbulbifer spongiae]|uniref:Bro-N domain-containing protein n=1 Tax=Microbulbifer spongiae TaxID=2944933 RepID=A0ABY9E5W9_9GAMM|nr:BRO family protein [Microbulbifer sp. MI-G]WKD48414.1 hypothetical protein M8T91_10780 [Microbulbifer sp. MI-G]